MALFDGIQTLTGGNQPAFGADAAFDYLTNSLGFPPSQAAALVGNIQQESSFNPTNVNRGEGAYGLLQWRQSRLDDLKNFAASTGRDFNDPYTQLDFIKHEMGNKEARSASPFQDSIDLPSANSALRGYIRYGDNSQNARLNFAQKFLGSPPLAIADTQIPRTPAPSPLPSRPAIQPQSGSAPLTAYSFPAMPGAAPQQQPDYFSLFQPSPLQPMPSLKRQIDLSRIQAMLHPASSRVF